MMSNSRSTNSIRNITVAFASNFCTTLLKFFLQTVFIKILGAEYLGVNGLFTNILTVLSFAELGIGNAIIFSMYKPIAENNIDKIKSLMKLYKVAYRFIGIFVFIAGLLLVPFLNFIVTDVPNIKESIISIYILFLINTSISYFFSYKKSIITANQKDFIVTINNLFFFLIRGILQIIFLVITKNYIMYLIIQIICTFLENYIISNKANHMYPYLNDKNVDDLSKNEKDDIFKNVKSLVVYKFGSVILNGTDNIIVSSMLGTSLVGILSNYSLIINAISGIINNALSGFTASIGNLNAVASIQKKKSIYNQLFLISYWIYSTLFMGLILLLNPFIEIWVGVSYCFDSLTVFIISFNFLIDGLRFTGYTYRNTMGLFKKGKYAPIIAAFLNILLSIILGLHFGIFGILLATLISRVLTTVWYDPYLVYKYKFNESPMNFYIKYISYLIILAVIYFINARVIELICVAGLIGFIIKGFVIVILTNLLLLIIFNRNKDFIMIRLRLINIIKSYRRK
jgi:O-antigen/teichoic acid export membrane protein